MDWLCFPRFDSRSVFARLLDESAGHWSIRPSSADAQISRRYIEHTMVLETTFRTSTGTALLMDALAIGRNERGHEVGADSPGVLLRQITCTSGEMALDVEYAPRPEYGLICPLLALTAGSVAARGGADVLMLSSLVEAYGRGLHGAYSLHVARRRDSRLRTGTQRELGASARGVVTGSNSRPARRYNDRLAHVVVTTSGVRRSVARSGPS